MKKIILLAVAVVVAAACSSPRYTYHFDTYTYRSAKDATKPSVEESMAQPTPVDEQTLTASADENRVYLAESPLTVETQGTSKEEAVKTFKSLTKEEKKAFKKELKAEIKNLVKAKKEGSLEAAKGGLDGDLKLAAIFGAIGLVLLIIGGDIGIVGVIALLVGLFFLVRYLMRQ
jgi:hypothetical protein